MIGHLIWAQLVRHITALDKYPLKLQAVYLCCDASLPDCIAFACSVQSEPPVIRLFLSQHTFGVMETRNLVYRVRLQNGNLH